MKPKLFLLFIIYNFSFCIVATATIRYVSKTGSSTPPYTSWATASDSIQKCINICQSGDTVYVANGVYKEKVVMIPGLSLIGGGTDSCIIDTKELAQPTDFYAVTFSDSCTLKQFHIEVSFSKVGLGILVINWSSIAPVNGLIEKNKITNAGIGIWIEGGNVRVKNNLIFNVDDGIEIGAINSNYYPVIDSNHISVTSQGIHISVGTKPTIRNNTFYLDDPFASAYSGGGSDTAKVYNNLAIVKHGDVIYGLSGVPTLANNNIAHGNFDEGIRFGTPHKVKNNIMQNGTIGFRIVTPAPICNYNDSWNNEINYQNFTPDSTNLSVDPMLLNDDMNSLDFHLQMYSPLIDAGDPNILDRDGSRSDIGLFGGPYGEKYTYRDLAPKPPKNLTAQMVGGFVKLKWNKNTEADFSHYRIYRDTMPHFIYDTTKIVGITSDTTFLDHLPVTINPKKYYYLATAMDSANHQSAPSEEVMVLVTGMNEVPPIVVKEYKLLNNYPNPFNSSTLIPYRLKEGGQVKLKIYNMLGELVSVLLNDYQPAGYHEAVFKPNEREKEMGRLKVEWPTGYNDDIVSGIYIYHIMVYNEGQIPVFSEAGRMLYLK